MRASSSRLPPQRTRVTSSGEPPRTSVQLAANGRSRRAATCPSTSLPRFVPAATTAPGAQAVDQVEHAPRPRPRGVGGEPLVLGHVSARHTVGAQRGRGLTGAGAYEQRVQRLPGRELAGQRERLQGELVDPAGLVLHKAEDHQATPSSRMTSTTAGAASAPWPSTAACLPWPGGSTSRSFSSFGSGRCGSLFSIGFWRARSFAGTEG